MSVWTAYFIFTFVGVVATLYLIWLVHRVKQYKRGYEMAWEANMHSDNQLLGVLAAQEVHAPDHALPFYKGVKDACRDFKKAYMVPPANESVSVLNDKEDGNSVA